MVNAMVKENITTKMGVYMMDNGLMEKSTDTVLYIIEMVKLPIRENGRMRCLMGMV